MTRRAEAPMATRKPAPQSDPPKLAAPAMRALASAGPTSIAKLSMAREADIMALLGMGPNAMTAIRAAMKTKGVSFAKR